MGKAVLIIHTLSDRAKAIGWVQRAPGGTRLTFQGPKRSIPQNDRLWALLTEISTQKTWHGVRLEPADWKHLFMAALNRELRIVPNLDGNGFVNLGSSSSALSKADFSDLMEIISAWGSANGVTFHDQSPTPVHALEDQTL